MQNYTLTLDNGHVVYMTILPGFDITTEIAKYESSLPTDTTTYNLSVFGNPLPTKVVSYVLT